MYFVLYLQSEKANGGGPTTWVCTGQQRHKCTAKVKEMDQCYQLLATHNHAADIKTVRQAQFKQMVKYFQKFRFKYFCKPEVKAL